MFASLHELTKQNTIQNTIPVTREFELITRRFELATRGFKLVTCGFELVTHVLLFRNVFPIFLLVSWRNF